MPPTRRDLGQSCIIFGLGTLAIASGYYLAAFLLVMFWFLVYGLGRG